MDGGPPDLLRRGEELGFPRSGSDGPAEHGGVRTLLQAVPARGLLVVHADRQVGDPSHRPGQDGPVADHRPLRLVAEAGQSGQQCVQAIQADDDLLADAHTGRLIAGDTASDRAGSHTLRPSATEEVGTVATVIENG